MDQRSHVLVVDDEIGPRESLKMLLKPEYQVSATPRGSDAIQILQDEPYDVVLLDLTMPGDLSGSDTLRAIRAADIDVEAIVITGQGSLDTAVECLRLGARDYIAKPFRGNAVLAAVRNAIAGRAARKRALQVREHFLGNLSHEFRTPLNAIVGYSEILHDEAGDRLTDEHRHALDRIQHNSERLLTYLEGLFFLTEIDAGSLRLQRREFQVRPWLEKLLVPISRQALENGLVLESHCPEGLVTTSDPETLSRLITVLAYEVVAGARTGIGVFAAPRQDGGLEVQLVTASEIGDESGPPSPQSGSGGAEPSPSAEDLSGQVLSRAARALGATIRTEKLSATSQCVRVTVAGPVECGTVSPTPGAPELAAPSSA